MMQQTQNNRDFTLIPDGLDRTRQGEKHPEVKTYIKSSHILHHRMHQGVYEKSLGNFQGFWWEQRESNPRPSACKADALNQLSYAPELGLQIYDDFLIMQTFFHYICILIQWGCFGFDSIRHWAVSTPGVVGLPVNLGLQTISWQQLLCTRCVVC